MRGLGGCGGTGCGHRVGKAVLHRKVVHLNRALHGAAGREHCGSSFVWRSCGENTLRSYRSGVCEVLMSVTSKHRPKPTKNVPYP